MRPAITLVTPVYNALPWLGEYLDCVKAQSWRPLEFILVDDGSTDGSAEYIEGRVEEFTQAGIALRLLRCPHRGQAAAMNEALPYISGEFFTWCDADDLLSPDSLEKKACRLMEHPEIGMLRSNGWIADADTGEILGESAAEADKADKDIFAELFCDGSYCYAGCYMLRSDLFFQGYPQRRMPLSPEGQNLQLLLPAASRSICGYIDEKLHTYRRHAGSHSSRGRSYQQALQRIENFHSLKMELLDYCLCDREHYAKLAELCRKQAKTQLLQQAAQQAREERRK